MPDTSTLGNTLVFAGTKLTLRVRSTPLATKSHSAQVKSPVGRTSTSVSPKAVGR
jgi:hypothetical protein